MYQQGRARRLAAGVMTTLALGAFAGPAHAAEAAEYDVSSCKANGVGTGAAWQLDVSGTGDGSSNGAYADYGHTINCAPGRLGMGMRFSAGGATGASIARGTYMTRTFDAPAGTHIVGAHAWHNGITRTTYAQAFVKRYLSDGRQETVGSLDAGPFSPGYWGRELDSYQTAEANAGEAIPIPSSGANVVSLAYLVACQNDACPAYEGGDGSRPGGQVRVWGSVVTLADHAAPTIGAPTGDLWTASTVAGTETMDVPLADAGSGVRTVELLVDGTDVSTTPVGCSGVAPSGRAYLPRPCPSSETVRLALDTTTLSEGEHTIEVRARDFAGSNSAAGARARTVTVDNIVAPENTSAPRITGVPKEGVMLSGDAGAWTGQGITYTYRWQRNNGGWEDIGGAVQAEYTPSSVDAGRSLRLRVAARNAGGSVAAFSEPTGLVAGVAPPQEQAGGIPAPGSTTTNTTLTSPTLVLAPDNGQGATRTVAISASRVGSTSKTLRVRYAERVPLSGRLSAVSGAPISGARVDVLEQNRTAGARLVKVGEAVTDRDGIFRWVAGRGVGRLVRFAYKANLADVNYTETTDVIVSVLPSVSLTTDRRTVRNKRSVRFVGRVAGAPSGARKLVELQVRKGTRWQTFATVRMSRGRFSHRYRFVATTRRTTYRFRARVRTEAGWPFETGASKTRKVTVRP